ncbi:MAG: OmpA family protein [Glaciecola sp.]
MKKLSLMIALALGSASVASNAQEAPDYENWVGGFGQFYSSDPEKLEPIGGFQDGKGFGGELGFRFDPAWAVRFELGRVMINNNFTNPLATDDDGSLLGADVMYFLDQDVGYVFSGLREQSLSTDSFRMLSAGVGKHWEVSDNLRLITEVAAFHDFGEGYREYSAKLGLAYIFGTNSAPAPQPDTDGDGVYDAVDRCPTTPAGTQVDPTGCNVDMDGDGVLNGQDACPTTPQGSMVDARGCAIKDADKDGVLDNVDSCLNSAPNATVNAKGCAVNLDVDGDGVLDSQDKCLGTPATDKVDDEGCSIFEKKEVSVALDLLFANNSSVITNPDSARIQEFVAFMKRYPNTQAVVEGHTSSVGSAEYNQFLSDKRAKAVRELLISEYGVDANRLSAQGFGESQLKDTSNTAAAHKVNRRIEVKVTAIVESKVTR